MDSTDSTRTDLTRKHKRILRNNPKRFGRRKHAMRNNVHGVIKPINSKHKKADIVVEAVLGIILGVLLILFLIKGVVPRLLGVSDYNKYIDNIATAVREASDTYNLEGKSSAIVKLPKKSAVVLFSADQEDIGLLYSQLEQEVELGKFLKSIASKPHIPLIYTVAAAIGIGVIGTIATLTGVSEGLGMVATITVATQAFMQYAFIGAISYTALVGIQQVMFYVHDLAFFEIKGKLNLDKNCIITFDKPDICGDSACVCLCRDVKLEKDGEQGEKELTVPNQQGREDTITAKAKKAVCGQVYCRTLGNNLFLTNLGTIEYYKNMKKAYGGSNVKHTYIDKKIKIVYTGLFPLEGYVIEKGLTNMPNPKSRVLYFERALKEGQGAASRLVFGTCEFPPCVNELTKQMLLAQTQLGIIGQALVGCDSNNKKTSSIISNIANQFLEIDKEEGSFSLAFHKITDKDRKNIRTALEKQGQQGGSEDNKDSQALKWLDESSFVIMFLYRPAQKDSWFKKMFKNIFGGNKDVHNVVAIQPLPGVGNIVLEKKESDGSYSEFTDFEVVKREENKLMVTYAYKSGHKTELNFPLSDVTMQEMHNEGNEGETNNCEIEFYMNQR